MEAGSDFNAMFSKVVAQAWSDPDYKARLIADPRAALEEAGVILDDDADIQVVEDTAQVRHIVLPAPPAEGELSEDALEQVAGGTTKVTWKT